MEPIRCLRLGVRRRHNIRMGIMIPGLGTHGNGRVGRIFTSWRPRLPTPFGSGIILLSTSIRIGIVFLGWIPTGSVRRSHTPGTGGMRPRHFFGRWVRGWRLVLPGTPTPSMMARSSMFGILLGRIVTFHAILASQVFTILQLFLLQFINVVRIIGRIVRIIRVLIPKEFIGIHGCELIRGLRGNEPRVTSISTSAHGGKEHSGRDNSGNGFTGPIPHLLIPRFSNHIQKQTSRHFRSVGWFKVGRKVIGRSTIAKQVNTMRTCHFFRRGSTFNVTELRVEILRSLLPPCINDAFGVRKEFIHVFDRFPTHLPGKCDLKGTFHPACSHGSKVFI